MPTSISANKWIAADEAFDRGQQAYLDWCRAIAKLAENIDIEGKPLPRSHKDYTTQDEIATRYNKERVRIAEAIQIGRDDRFVHNVYKSIPRDKKVIYQLTMVPDKEFVELCKPTTTRASFDAYMKRLKAPPISDTRNEAPPPTRPPCPGVEGYGAGCWYWSDAFEEWCQHPPLEQILKNIDERNKVPPISMPPKPNGLAVIREELEELLKSPAGLKALQRMFASLYHPDKGKDTTQRLARLNQAFDLLKGTAK